MGLCPTVSGTTSTQYMTPSSVLHVGPWKRLKSPYIASQVVARVGTFIVPRAWPKSPQLKVSFVGISEPWGVILISLLAIEMDCNRGRKHMIDDAEGYSSVQIYTRCDYVHTHNGLTHSNTIVLSHDINCHCAMVVG